MLVLLRRLVALALLPGTRDLTSEEKPLPVRPQFMGRRSTTDYTLLWVQKRIA